MRSRKRVVDSSDESGSDDGGSGRDAPVGGGIIDAEVEDSSDDRSDGDSDDSSSSLADGLLDVEAEEGSDESSDHSDGESNDSDSDLGNEFLDMEAMDFRNASPSPISSSPLESFPQFVRLPPELRQRVWELFCPDLESRFTRVVPLTLAATYPGESVSPFWQFSDENITLQDQTRLVRVVSAVHHESRALVVRRFPDQLPITYGLGPEAYVRFNGDKDILALEFTEPSDTLDTILDEPSISRNREIKWVRRVAFDTCWFYQNHSDMASVLAKFPQVETVFCWVRLTDAAYNVRWTASPFANRYYLQTSEEVDGFQHDLDFIFCWPDLANHPDFAKYHIIPAFRESVSKGELAFFDSKDVTFAPMVSFELSSGVKEYDRLRRENEEGVPVDQSDDLAPVYDSELESGPQSVDEYESDGIDDAEIEEYDESSEDEVIPGPIVLTDNSEAGNSGDDEGPERAGGDEPVGGGPSRRRKRRVVSDSDDDDDDGEPVAKRVRVSNAAAADDDSDERDEEGGAESNDSGEGSGESETSQSSASDDEDQPPVRLSLAERLRQFRDDNPIPSDEDSSDTAGHDEAGDEVEDEDEEDDEDEDERGDGFIDDMAEDSEDASDGSQESDGY